MPNVPSVKDSINQDAITFLQQLIVLNKDAVVEGERRRGWLGLRWRYDEKLKYADEHWEVSNAGSAFLLLESLSAPNSRDTEKERKEKEKRRAIVVYGALRTFLHSFSQHPEHWCSDSIKVQLQLFEKQAGYLTKKDKKLNKLITRAISLLQANDKELKLATLNYSSQVQQSQQDWVGIRFVLENYQTQLHTYLNKNSTLQVRISQDFKIDGLDLATVKKKLKEQDSSWWRGLWPIRKLMGVESLRKPYVYCRTQQLLEATQSTGGIEKQGFNRQYRHLEKHLSQLSRFSELTSIVRGCLQFVLGQKNLVKDFIEKYPIPSEKGKADTLLSNTLSDQINLKSLTTPLLAESFSQVCELQWQNLVEVLKISHATLIPEQLPSIQEAVQAGFQQLSVENFQGRKELEALNKQEWKNGTSIQQIAHYNELVGIYEGSVANNHALDKMKLTPKLHLKMKKSIEQNKEQQLILTQHYHAWQEKSQALMRYVPVLTEYWRNISELKAALETKLVNSEQEKVPLIESTLEEMSEYYKKIYQAVSQEINPEVKTHLQKIVAHWQEETTGEFVKQLPIQPSFAIVLKQSSSESKNDSGKSNLSSNSNFFDSSKNAMPSKKKNEKSKKVRITNLEELKVCLKEDIEEFKAICKEQIKILGPIMQAYEKSHSPLNRKDYVLATQKGQAAEKIIKGQYKQLAMRYHPDKQAQSIQNEVKTLFQELQQCKELIWDEYLSAEYVDDDEDLSVKVAGIRKKVAEHDKELAEIGKRIARMKAGLAELDAGLARLDLGIEKVKQGFVILKEKRKLEKKCFKEVKDVQAGISEQMQQCDQGLAEVNVKIAAFEALKSRNANSSILGNLQNQYINQNTQTTIKPSL